MRKAIESKRKVKMTCPSCERVVKGRPDLGQKECWSCWKI